MSARGHRKLAGSRHAAAGGLRRLVLQIVDGVSDGRDLLGLLVGNRQVELLLKLHDEFDGVERVSAQVVREGSVGSHVRLVDAEFLHDDRLDACFDITGHSWQPLGWWNKVGSAGGGAGIAVQNATLAADILPCWVGAKAEPEARTRTRQYGPRVPPEITNVENYN